MKRNIFVLLAVLFCFGYAQVQDEDVGKLMDAYNTFSFIYPEYWRARNELAVDAITLSQYKQRVDDAGQLYGLAARLQEDASASILNSVQAVINGGELLNLRDKAGLRISTYVGNIKSALGNELRRADEATNKEMALEIGTGSDIVSIWQEFVSMSYDMYIHW